MKTENTETKQLNVEIPADLHRQTKAEAAFDGKTLEKFVIDLLTEKLGRRGEKSFHGALGQSLGLEQIAA